MGVFTAPYFINPTALGWNAKYGLVALDCEESNVIC